MPPNGDSSDGRAGRLGCDPTKQQQDACARAWGQRTGARTVRRCVGPGSGCRIPSSLKRAAGLSAAQPTAGSPGQFNPPLATADDAAAQRARQVPDTLTVATSRKSERERCVRHAAVLLDGVRTWYEQHGDGDPLVLLHPGGAGVDARAFGPNLRPTGRAVLRLHAGAACAQPHA